MNILFTGVYADRHLITLLNRKSDSNGNLSVAAIKYTKSIVAGLAVNEDVKLTKLYLVPIGVYPTCKVILMKKTKIGGENYIPFINIILLKQIMIMLYVSVFTLKWYWGNRRSKENVVLFGFIYLPFKLAVLPLRLILKFKIASFVPDLPQYEFSYSKEVNRIKRILIPFYINTANFFINRIDYFVFITKYMVSLFNPKPHVIIEGFVDPDTSVHIKTEKGNKQSVMYAGALHEKFGVKTLIEAFVKIEKDCELWLFGDGDLKEYITSLAKRDDRIKYYGVRSNVEVLQYELKATVLINPRSSKDEYTKYSFPSKILEYMHSGTPLLSTKLPGIPNDYQRKVFFIEDESVEGFYQSIQDVLNLPQPVLDEFGQKAKQYVLETKNTRVQIAKFVSDLKTVLSD